MKVAVAVLLVSALMAGGCASEKFVSDSKNPEVAFSSDGGLMWRGEFIEPDELPYLLKKTKVNPKSQIDIRIPQDFSNPKAARSLLFLLRRAGYTRAVLVTEKKAYSGSSMRKPAPQPVRKMPPSGKRIRYK